MCVFLRTLLTKRENEYKIYKSKGEEGNWVSTAFFRESAVGASRCAQEIRIIPESPTERLCRVGLDGPPVIEVSARVAERWARCAKKSGTAELFLRLLSAFCTQGAFCFFTEVALFCVKAVVRALSRRLSAARFVLRTASAAASSVYRKGSSGLPERTVKRLLKALWRGK